MDGHEALARRLEEAPADEPAHADSIELDPDSIELDPALPGVRAAGIEVRLTRTEFRLLQYLAAQEPRWVKAGELLDNVLPAQVTRDTTLVRVHMLNIRKKLGGLARCLSTERRFGTRLFSKLPPALR